MIVVNADEADVKNIVHDRISNILVGKQIVKEIYVKGKIYNIVVK